MRIPDERTRAWLWLVAVSFVAAWLAVLSTRGLRIGTNILDLLPTTERDPVVAAASRTYGSSLGQRLVFLVGHRDPAVARLAAGELADGLTASPLYAQVTCRLDDTQQRAWYELYFPHRMSLLTAARRQQLDGDGTEAGRQAAGAAFLRERLHLIYSPMGTGQTQLLDRDPLLLFPEFVQDLGRQGAPGQARPVDGMLMVQDGATHYVLVAAVARDNPFARDAQEALVAHLDPTLAALKARHAGVNVLEAGVLRFAEYAGRTAQWEASTIGLGSLIGVIFVLLWTFRSPRRLLIGMLPIGVGLLVAFTVSYTVFDGLHVITLAFGASLIGVCVDYTLHYYSDELLGDESWTPQSGMAHVLPGMTIGVLSSIVAYLALSVPPFPGLRQMAVFSATGLVAAFVTEYVWLPLLTPRQHVTTSRRPLIGRLAAWQLTTSLRWRTGLAARLALGALIVWCVVGLWRLRTDDDVRSLHSAPSQLVRDQATVSRLFGVADGNRYFVVEGSDAAAALEREEALHERLAASRAAGEVTNFRGVSTFVPSPTRQAGDRRRLENVVFNTEQLRPISFLVMPTPHWQAYVEALGLDPHELQPLLGPMLPRSAPLTVDDWLASPASLALRQLWLGNTARGVATVTMLDGVRDEAAMRRLAGQVEGVHYVNQVDDINGLLRDYRRVTGYMLGMAYFGIFTALVWRYGWRRGWRVLAAPLLAALATVATHGIFGWSLNLFGLLALLLVLGLGIDYSTFLAEARDRAPSTMLAIVLSALTTLLSFGLLALSSTPILHDFGRSMAIGIVLCLCLAPCFVALAPSPSPSRLPEDRS